MSETNNNLKGTVQENKNTDQSSSAKTLLFSLIQSRDIYLVIGLVLGLHLLGIIDVPFVSELENMPYYDAIVTVIVAVLVSITTVWGRVRAIIDEIYSKEWAHVAYVDATGEDFGVWKTDPETISKLNEHVRIEGSESLSQYREGIDVAGRRYALVQDLRKNDDPEDEADWVLTETQGFEDIADHDQIIADKTTLKDWVDTVLPEAEKGRKLRKNMPMIKQKIRIEEAKEIAIGLSRALSGSSVEGVLSDMISTYENKEQTLEDKLSKQKELDELREMAESQEPRDFDNIDTSTEEGGRR
ncbi:hypothetical protein BDK61_2865 [Haloarcula quadrata]|uniref:Uncharacterized protein n=1 Tax=Haloarcula quadrata TaxID=182779 RepID=A0A495R8E7_9EURY|nr:hypothetical protein [Haloarcula quadrata]RKS83480.1 hypothetical protein BDK61_2865 [Haloarcula quadrata]